MPSIEKTLFVMQELSKIGLEAVEVSKNFSRTFTPLAMFRSLDEVYRIGGSAKRILKASPEVFPELMDLDMQEVEVLTKAAYKLVREVVLRIQEA